MAAEMRSQEPAAKALCGTPSIRRPWVLRSWWVSLSISALRLRRRGWVHSGEVAGGLSGGVQGRREVPSASGCHPEVVGGFTHGDPQLRGVGAVEVVADAPGAVRGGQPG